MTTCHPIPSLPRGFNMIHKVHNVLPKNVRHLQCCKMTSLKEIIVSRFPERKGPFHNVTLSCALKKDTFPVASAQLFGAATNS